VKQLRISPDLALPLEAEGGGAVTQTFAVIAKRRAGKSYFARRFVEQLARAGQQVVMVDPKGDQWGIRSSADGKGPGLPIVILGGERHDVKLEPNAGEVVAKLVVEEGVSALLDLSLFRKSEVASFMGGVLHGPQGFLEALYRLKAHEKNRTAMMLVIDESDAIAPQKPMKGEERMLGACEDIVRRGGQRGIGCMFVTQRTAVLNKNVLTQAQVLVALRTIAPQDLTALDAWIDVHGTREQRAELMATLPSLPVGDAWVWSPGWPTSNGIFQRIHTDPIETFDSGATPKTTEKRVEPKRRADVDLAALERQMAATIERAKAEDPRELRRRIAELERELKERVKGVLLTAREPKQPKRVEVPVLKDAQVKRLEAAVEKLHHGAQKHADMGQALLRKGDDILTALTAARDSIAGVSKPSAPGAVGRAGGSGAGRPEGVGGGSAGRVVPARPLTVGRGIEALIPNTSSDWREPAGPRANGKGRGGAAQRILDSLAELEILGAAQPERTLVAFLAGYSNLTSKGLVNALGALRTAGLIDYPGQGQVALTAAGAQEANPPERPRSSKELQQRVIRLLGGASARLLEPLIAAYPKTVDRDELAAAAGYGNLTSKGFVNAIGRLRTLGFVDYPTPGQVVAKPVLFLEGGGVMREMPDHEDPPPEDEGPDGR
jgi:hypothetical protein